MGLKCPGSVTHCDALAQAHAHQFVGSGPSGSFEYTWPTVDWYAAGVGSPLHAYIVHHRLTCTPTQLQAFLGEFNSRWVLLPSMMFAVHQSDNISGVNLLAFAHCCPFCAHSYAFLNTQWALSRLYPLVVSAKASAADFQPMLENAVPSFSALRDRWFGILREELQSHDDSHPSITCGQYAEWAPKSSTAFTPLGPPVRKPFLLSPAWARNLNLVDSMGLKNVSALFDGLSPDLCEKCVGNALKRLAVIAKASSADVLEASWLVDINRWRGHMPPLSGKQLFDAASKWLCTPHEQVDQFAFPWLVLNFSRGASWLASVFRQDTPDLTYYVDHFWSARPWGTTGASDRHNIVIAFESGKPVLADKTKNMIALYSTTKQLVDKLLAPHRETILVGPKFNEYGKSRHILRGDDTTYLAHSLADGILFSAIRVGPNARMTPLTSSPNDWRLVMRLIGKGVDQRYLNVLFDHSGFDEHQSVFLVRSFLTLLLESARNRNVPQTQSYLYYARYNATLSSRIEVPGGLFVGRHVGGLPSGWRWTALLDTILNIACTMSAWRLVAPIAHHHIAVMLGDDSLVQVDAASTPDALSVASMLTKLGYDLNPTKNYMSRKCGDFLGYSFYGSNRIFGAPSRLMVSITCRHNTREPTGGQLAVAFSRLWLWALFRKRAERSGITIPVEFPTWVVRDCMGASGLDGYSSLRCMDTPKSLGGVGIVGVARYLGVAPMPTSVHRVADAEFDSERVRIPPTLSWLPGDLSRACVAQYLQSTGFISMTAAPRFQFRTAVSHAHNLPHILNGHLTMKRCVWADWVPATIQPTLIDIITRRRDQFQTKYFDLLAGNMQATYRWMLNRGHSWAVMRAWLTDRLPYHSKFVFDGDELDLISPARTTADLALSALSARHMNMSTWQLWVESFAPTERTLFDSNWVSGRYMPKPDETTIAF